MKNSPEVNQAEITLLGTGGGYGECIVGHLGSNNWFVVDSCINPFTKIPLAIEYLNEIGINIENDVKLIICTHWHDDHIKGISEIFALAQNAKIAILKIHDIKKFIRFIAFDSNKDTVPPNNVSTKEMYNILDILSVRGMKPILAGADKTLFTTKVLNNFFSSIISLSPSDQSVINFDKEVVSMIQDYSYSNLKVYPENPNSKSVVVLVQIGDHSALLGADMEVVNNPDYGWISILNNSQFKLRKSTYFKISHHGSENAHHERIWDEMLENMPVGTLTPWNRNTKLPKIEMLSKFCKKSDKIFMTSPVSDLTPKKRPWDEQKMIEKLGYKLHEIKYHKGIIRSRINLNDPKAEWHTTTFDNAFCVNSNLK